MMKSSRTNRQIVQFKGEGNGPILIVIGSIHGNEHAGVKGIKLVEKMLEVEPITNPNFSFRGQLYGLIGNVSAFDQNVRYIEEDLNRIWQTEIISSLRESEVALKNERHELFELLNFITDIISKHPDEEICILDLHTTSSPGGIFAIPNSDPKSQAISRKLHAPVILDMLQGISGTTLHYFNEQNFPNKKVTCVTFEAGQHEEKMSINRCIAAIVNCLRSIGCVSQEDVENIHDHVLSEYAEKFPAASRLIHKHSIEESDQFKMLPGFSNFDVIRKGQKLGEDKEGDIICPMDGLILMPLYQKQGNEGFYIIRPES